MLGNVIDNRGVDHQHDILVHAVYEPSFHDNSCKNASQFDAVEVPLEDIAKCVHNTTVAQAIELANKFDYPVTVHLYPLHRNPMSRVEWNPEE